MLLNVIARGGDVFSNVRTLVDDNHEPRHKQRELAKQALAIYRTLRTAEIVEEHRVADTMIVDGEEVESFDERIEIRLTVDLQANFALNQPLSPFALSRRSSCSIASRRPTRST